MARTKSLTGGRPSIEIDKEQFEKLCAIQATEEEIAGWFKCSEETIRRFCKKTYKQQFCEVYKRLSANGRISLRRTQFRIAEAGNATMAIWLGKQILGQRDSQDVTLGTEKDFVINIMPASEGEKSEVE